MPAKPDLIKIVFASGSDDLNPWLIDEVAGIYPDLPLLVCSEFPPHRGEWIPYHVHRTFRENLAACRAAVGARKIRLSAVMLMPNMPYRRMKLMALLMSPRGFLAYNEHLGSFMLRPANVSTLARHGAWRIRNFVRWQLQPGQGVYTWLWRLTHLRKARLPLLHFAARIAGLARTGKTVRALPVGPDLPSGISVVIPSRGGKALLEQCLPKVLKEIGDFQFEIIVVDNGSDDQTGEWLRVAYPAILVDSSSAPLSFARAVNRGIARARYSHVCLLNNDMLVQPGFFGPLRRAFKAVPALFSATAQIFFPEGVRREETGKAVMRQTAPTDFPVRCDDPIPGEDLTYVLYGSGGCSLYCGAKLRALGGVSEIYEPAYVEDLDLGYRAWLRGWPSVFSSDAHVIHRHRSTTSQHYKNDELGSFIEINYLKFLANAIGSRNIFRQLWTQAIDRLLLLSIRNDKPAFRAIPEAWKIALRAILRRYPGAIPDARILALTGGDVAVFPGRPRTGSPVVLIATPYLPYPLAHGGAVRMFNLMCRAAVGCDQVLVAFCDELAAPPPELLAFCCEIVLVRRTGSHFRKSTGRPDVVEEFDVPAFHAAVRQTVEKWSPAVAQLEFTQMAQYAKDCAPARTLLVEHDITFDLQQQLLDGGKDWERSYQLVRWRKFETDAWKRVNRVVTMSEKDRQTVGAKGFALPNGVDLARFRPGETAPETGRLLFIGSFAHLPNILALEFFLGEVWPLLDRRTLRLHVIAGSRHEYFLQYYNVPKLADALRQCGIEMEGFVADVRPAYQRAQIVIAPLLASAGTNIKILEAMAMGKAIVSTTSGINGLDLSPGEDVAVVDSPGGFADAISRLVAQPDERLRLERVARRTVEKRYDWDRIARLQSALYEELRSS
ncbi:MAG: glycosyltransferase [Bryobacteraceae bacterium]